MRNPLALSLARDTHTHTHADPTDLLTHATPDALLRHLLTRLLAQAYPDPAEHAHAVRWLTWIAEHLHGHRDIRWWDIPTWMTGAHPRLIAVLKLTIMLAGLLVFGQAGGLAFGLALGLAGGNGPTLSLARVELVWTIRGTPSASSRCSRPPCNDKSCARAEPSTNSATPPCKTSSWPPARRGSTV